MRLVRLLAIGLLLMGAGCSSRKDSETKTVQTATEPVVFQAPRGWAGRLRRPEGGHGLLVFVPCDSMKGPSPILRDLPDSSAAKLLASFGGSASVVIRLDGELREIRFAGPGEIDCAHLLSDGDLKAQGNEPFWSAVVDQGEVTVRTPERQDGVLYGSGRWSHPDSSHWRYEAKREGEDLTLEITQTPCFDSMSGARFPFKAVLIRGGVRVEGCALEGRRAMARE